MANIKVGLTKKGGRKEVYNKQWINSIESTSQSTTDPATIEYGVLANSGNINFRDLDGRIKRDISIGSLPISNVETTISINDTQIQAHLTNDSNYTESDKTLSLSLTNKLSLFDSMSYNGFPLSETPMTAYELLSDIFSKLGVDMANDVTFTTDALNALTAITIPYPYIKPCSGREALNKICEIAQLSMFQSGNGKIRVISTTQKNSTAPVYPYNVPSHYKITELNKAIVLKNKYDAIDMKATRVVDEIDFNKLYLTKEVEPSGYLTNPNNQNVSKKEIANVDLDAGEIVYGKIYMDSYYMPIDITVPKKKNYNLSSLISLLLGKNENGQPNIRYNVTYQKNKGVLVPKEDKESTNIDDFQREQTSSEIVIGDIPSSYSYQYVVVDMFGQSKSITIEHSFNNLSTNGKINVATEDDNNYYVSLLLLVGGKYVGVRGFSNEITDAFYNETGQYEHLIPQKVEISFYGNIREVTFEDVDASTSNISTAKNPVSLRHNELMQLGATWGDTSLVDKIKDNVLTDYENGIPTATIDLFCGSLSNGRPSQTIDWASGEILSVGDKIKFSDDKEELVWDITGRTFTYNASPKIRLELKKLSTWNSVWNGQQSVNFPKRAGTIKFADGYYYGSETTYISLSDYLKNPNYAIRISGNGLYLYFHGSGTAYTVENLELSTFSTIIKDNDNEGVMFGYITARYNAETQQIEFTATGRSTTSGGLLTPTITFNLTKIEQYY